MYLIRDGKIKEQKLRYYYIIIVIWNSGDKLNFCNFVAHYCFLPIVTRWIKLMNNQFRVFEGGCIEFTNVDIHGMWCSLFTHFLVLWVKCRSKNIFFVWWKSKNICYNRQTLAFMFFGDKFMVKNWGNGLWYQI